MLEAVRQHTASIYAVEAAGREADPLSLRDSDVRFLGSGFAFGDAGCVATCAHLFGEAPAPLVVRFGDGSWCAAELRGRSAAADVAVLRLLPSDASAQAPAALGGAGALRFAAVGELRQGEHVVVCGATQHGHETVGLLGVVSQPRQTFRAGIADECGVRFVQLAVPTLPGMSGSPVMNARGEVVAMLAKKFEEHGLALPGDRVAAVSRCLEQGHPWRPPVLGLDLEAGGSLAVPRVVVQAVRRGGAAEAAGLQLGDEVFAVAGEDVREVLGRLAAAPAAEVRLSVRRGSSGETLELCVRPKVA